MARRSTHGGAPARGLFAGEPDTPPSADRRYARVAVERSIDEPFTYAIDDPTLEVRVGQRVHVPLGSARTFGYVLDVGGAELLGEIDPRRVKGILGATPSALPADLVRLAAWMSRYYVTPFGMTLTTLMPASIKKGTGAKSIRMLEPAASETLSADARAGAVESLTPRARDALGHVDEIGAGEFPMAERDLMARLGVTTRTAINRLVAAGLLRESTESTFVAREPIDISVDAAPTNAPHELTDEQRTTVDGIVATLGSFTPHLILGVTGSGKTEVYLQVIARVLERGQTAIVLVPEIALTPQTSARFTARFAGAGVAVLHSALTAAQRSAQWNMAATGKARVVVGARSAVFAPLPDLGVIVVDEEHSTDYKQDQLPRYNGRDVAVKRASLLGIPVVLGSATPSLESWHNATHPAVDTSTPARDSKPRYALWRMRRRAAGQAMPRVTVVNADAERRARLREQPGDRTIHTIGQTLEGAIRRTLPAGHQAILVLNRRGFASYIVCPRPTCGWILSCDSCDARLVFHKGGTLPRQGLVRCHHCLAEQMLPPTCPVCDSRPTLFGAGTQRVEDEIRRKFVDQPLGEGRGAGLIENETFARVDGDTMGSAKDYFAVLSRFARGELRLLLGTQIISKGLDFPRVALVGIVSADTALALPDFRCAERTFQLVSQSAGRAGRGVDGEVIVQTCEPDSPAIRFASGHDYEGFAAEESRARRSSELPPWSRMARVVTRDENHDKAKSMSDSIARELVGANVPGVRVIGPFPAPISRIHGFYRYAIEMTSPNAGRLLAAIDRVRARGLLKSDATNAVDVDPTSML